MGFPGFFVSFFFFKLLSDQSLAQLMTVLHVHHKPTTVGFCRSTPVLTRFCTNSQFCPLMFWTMIMNKLFLGLTSPCYARTFSVLFFFLDIAIHHSFLKSRLRCTDTVGLIFSKKAYAFVHRCCHLANVKSKGSYCSLLGKEHPFLLLRN